MFSSCCWLYPGPFLSLIVPLLFWHSCFKRHVSFEYQWSTGAFGWRFPKMPDHQPDPWSQRHVAKTRTRSMWLWATHTLPATSPSQNLQHASPSTKVTLRTKLQFHLKPISKKKTRMPNTRTRPGFDQGTISSPKVVTTRICASASEVVPPTMALIQQNMVNTSQNHDVKQKSSWIPKTPGILRCFLNIFKPLGLRQPKPCNPHIKVLPGNSNQVLRFWERLRPASVPGYRGTKEHNYGKSPFLMGKSTINGNFQ